MSITLEPALRIRLLTDALCHCIDRGRAASQIPETRRRSVAEQLVKQHLQTDGSLDLTALWSAILREPGVTERAIASTIAALEDVQGLLQVPMRPAQRLQALKPQQRQALLAECPVSRVEIERLAKNARIESQLASARSRPGTSSSPSVERPNLSGVFSAVPLTPAPPVSGVLSQPMAHLLASNPAQVPAVQVMQEPAAVHSIPPGSGMAQTSSPTPTPIPAPSPVPTPGPPKDTDAEKEARVRAARALLDQANAEMQGEASGRIRTGSVSPVPAQRTGKLSAVSKGKAQGSNQGQTKKVSDRAKIIVIAVTLLLSAAGIAAWLYFGDVPKTVELSTVTALRLGDGQRVGDAVIAPLTDSTWKKLAPEAQKKSAMEAFRQVTSMYPIHILTLTNEAGTIEVQVSDTMPGATPTTPVVLLTGNPAKAAGPSSGVPAPAPAPAAPGTGSRAAPAAPSQPVPPIRPR